MLKRLMCLLLTLLIFYYAGCFAKTDDVNANTYYVSEISGDDINGNGSIEHPYKTIQRAADLLCAGDTLIIREGTYRETVTIPVSGDEGKHITIKAYDGENPVISGCDIVSNWINYKDNIYSTKEMTWSFDENTNQIFADDKFMTTARWPNLGEKGHLLSPEKWAVVDSGDSTYISDSELTQPDGTWNGAKLYIRNGSDWYSGTAFVDSYVKGRLNLKKFSWGAKPESYYAIKTNNKYYIYNTLATVDTPDEWYYDTDSKTLYFCSDTDPNKREITAKKRKYAIVMDNQSYIDISGITVRGASVSMDKANYITMDRMNIGYVTDTLNMNGNYCSLLNSHLFHAPSTILKITGDNNVVNNCLIEYGVYYATPSPMVITGGARRLYFGHNTLRYSGRDLLGHTAQESIFEYNDLYSCGLITSDNGFAYDGAMDPVGSEFRYNWLHDPGPNGVSMGFYNDNGGGNSLAHHNVVWTNSPASFTPLQLNLAQIGTCVYNNTFVGDNIGGVGANTICEDVRIVNNIFTCYDKMPEKMLLYNNMWCFTDPKFNAPENNDFTLSADSPAIDQGVIIEGITDNYNGNAPDLGAYEYGEKMWVPGCDFDHPPQMNFTFSNPKYTNKLYNGRFEKANSDLSNTEWTKFGDIENIKTSSGWSATGKISGLTARTGGLGLQLGNKPVKSLDNEYIDKCEYVADGLHNAKNLLNFPSYALGDVTETAVDTIVDLFISRANLCTNSDMEDESNTVNLMGFESCKHEVTDKEKCSGKKSLKIFDQKYSWSGPRMSVNNHNNKRYLVNFNIKATQNTVIDVRFLHNYENQSDASGIIYKTIKEGEWTNCTGSFIGKDNPEKGSILFTTNNNAEYYLDDINVIDISLFDSLVKTAAEYGIVIPDSTKELLKNTSANVNELSDGLRSFCNYLVNKHKYLAVDAYANVLKNIYRQGVCLESGIYQTIDHLKPNTTYKFMCRGWVVNEDDILRFEVTDYGGESLKYETNSKEWVNEPLYFTTGKENTTAKITITKLKGKSCAYIDDIAVFAVDNTVRKARSKVNIVDDGNFDDGDITYWYSYDSTLNVVDDNNSKVLEVSGRKSNNASLMQELRNISNGNRYLFDGKFKLGDGADDAADVVISLLFYSDRKLTEKVLAKSKITKDGYTSIENSEILDNIKIKATAIKIYLENSENDFYCDDISIAQKAMPTTPGTGDDETTINNALKDTKNWVASYDEQGARLASNGVYLLNGSLRYIGKTYRDFTMKFNMKIDGYKVSDYPILTIRNQGVNNYNSGYTFVFKSDVIELQRYSDTATMLYIGSDDDPRGLYGAAMHNTALIMGEENEIEVGSYNTEDGVRIILRVNGKTIYDILDKVDPLMSSGQISFFTGGVSQIAITPIK